MLWRIALGILLLCLSVLAFDLAMSYDVERHAERRTQTLSLSAHPRIDKHIPQGLHGVSLRLRRELAVNGSWLAWFARKVLSIVFFAIVGGLSIALVRRTAEPVCAKLTLISIGSATFLSAIIEYAQTGSPIADIAIDLGCGALGGFFAALLLRRTWSTRTGYAA
jgi:uncharacterized membrane protein SirB2